MRFCSIASGSSGNCIYVGSDRTHLLVDTGISKKRIEEGLKELEIKGEELDGILITHEHADHIQGLQTPHTFFHLNIRVNFSVAPSGSPVAHEYTRSHPTSHDIPVP